jgi:cytolysin-activating lysine-acyltransferase
MAAEPKKNGASTLSGPRNAAGAAGAAGAPGAARSAAAAGGKAGAGAKVAPQSQMAQTFAQVVAVLMRDARHRNLKLSDLEHLVLPPLMAGQFSLGHAPSALPNASKDKQGGFFVPVAVALWAKVSNSVDKGLSEILDKQVWLRPQEWTSGENLWLIAVAGNSRALPAFIKQVTEREFKGKRVKMRVLGQDGKVSVRVLGEKA